MAARNKISRPTLKSLGVKQAMAFDMEQGRIGKGAIAALAIAVTVLAACLLRDQPDLEFADPARSKLLLFLIAALLAGSLAAAIIAVAHQRFFEPLDREAAAAGTASSRIGQLQAILRNTHEQVTLAALVYSGGWLIFPPAWRDAIPAAAILFAIGRIFFAHGYAKGAAGRAFGFGLTFYPTILLALLGIYAALA